MVFGGEVLFEKLYDLHGVGGGPFPDVVGHDPEAEPVGGVGEVLSDAAHQHLVASLGQAWHGVDAALRVVLDLYAGLML